MVHLINSSTKPFALSNKIWLKYLNNGLNVQTVTRYFHHISNSFKNSGPANGQPSNHYYSRKQSFPVTRTRTIAKTSYSTSSNNEVFMNIYDKPNQSRCWPCMRSTLYYNNFLKTFPTNFLSSRSFNLTNIYSGVNNSEESQFDGNHMEQARQLINGLTVAQKRTLFDELQLEEAAERKKEAEEKLASWHWRSKFGRPTSVHPSKVDPSGTYCEIPQDWLLKKVAENTKDTPPTMSDLRKIAVFNALPFVGFGFLDNFIMIVAGDYIDLTIGVSLGISTMAAAALGNTISDLAGIGSAWYVEFLASKIGVRPPDLTKEQQNMSSSRWFANIGRGVGVCVGCILGMFPLLLISKHKGSDKEKKDNDEKEIKT